MCQNLCRVFFSDTQQRHWLPCASKKTHGKEKTLGKPHSSPCAMSRQTHGKGSARDRHVLMPSGNITGCDGDPSLPCAYTWHTAKPSFRHVPRAWHTTKSLHRQAGLTDVSVCRVPRERHGEKLLLPCASPLAHSKNQPLPYASL